MPLAAILLHTRLPNAAPPTTGCAHGGVSRATPLLESAVLTSFARCAVSETSVSVDMQLFTLAVRRAGKSEVLVRRAAHTKGVVVTGMKAG
jgi:hypothetical protein